MGHRGLGRAAGSSGRSGTVRGTLGEFQNGTGKPRGGPGRVWGLSGSLGMVREVRDGSGNPQ